MRTGIIACPVDPNISSLKYEKFLTELKPKFIIDNLNQIVINTNKDHINFLSQYNLDGIFLMLFSSGTTGKPKGILHKSKSLIASAKSFSNLSELNRDSVVLHHFPMYYMAGIFNMFLCPMVSGSKIVIGNQFTKEHMLNFWEIPMKYRVNILTLTPTMAIALVKVYREDKKLHKYIRSIKSAISTGSYLYNSIFEKFGEKFSLKLQTCYGITEAGGTITYKSKNNLSLSDSVGSYDTDTEFICNGTNEFPSKVYVRTPYMFSGYFINGKYEKFLSDKFFDTGDMGYIVKDQLYILGRIGDMIKKGGQFVSISAIENEFINISYIDELSIIPIEDEFWGSKILLFYVPKIKIDGIQVKLIKHAKNLLDTIEQPDEYIEVDVLPKTSVGKIIKKNLIKLYKEGK